MRYAGHGRIRPLIFDGFISTSPYTAFQEPWADRRAYACRFWLIEILTPSYFASDDYTTFFAQILLQNDYIARLLNVIFTRHIASRRRGNRGASLIYMILH